MPTNSAWISTSALVACSFAFVLGAFWTQRQGAAYVCLRVVGAVRTLLTMAQGTTAEHHAQVDAADRRLSTDADQLGMDLDFGLSDRRHGGIGCSVTLNGFIHSLCTIFHSKKSGFLTLEATLRDTFSTAPMLKE